MTSGLQQISMADYLALPYLSSGLCHTLLTCSPAHAKFEQDNERTATSVMDIGTYAHALLLEDGTLHLTIVDADDWRTKAAKELRDEAHANGRIPILKRKLPEVEAMVKAAHDYIAGSEIAGVFATGAAEQTLVWSEPMVAGVVLCKARPDWLSDKYLLHYKTTKASVNPRAFSRLAVGAGYDVAMMFYLRGLEAVKPDHEAQHFLLAQEQDAPYACKLFDLSAALADVAAARVSRAINAWASCQASGKWPLYDGSVHSIDVTPWELAQAEQDMLTDKELEHGVPL